MKTIKRHVYYLNYVENLLIIVLTVTGCISITAIASVVCFPVGITRFAVGLTICAIIAGIEKYTSIIKKKKKHDKILLLGKDRLNSMKVLISNDLINSCNNHGEFMSVNNVLQVQTQKEHVNSASDKCEKTSASMIGRWRKFLILDGLKHS